MTALVVVTALVAAGLAAFLHVRIERSYRNR